MRRGEATWSRRREAQRERGTEVEKMRTAVFKGVRSTSLSRCQWGKPEVSKQVGCATWGLEKEAFEVRPIPWPNWNSESSHRNQKGLQDWWQATRSVTSKPHRTPSSFLPPALWTTSCGKLEEFLCLISLGPFSLHCIPPIPPHQPSLEKQRSQALTERGGDTQGWMQRTEKHEGRNMSPMASCTKAWNLGSPGGWSREVTGSRPAQTMKRGLLNRKVRKLGIQFSGTAYS